MENFYKRLAMVFTTIALFTFIAVSQTTITVHLSDPNDDCEEYLIAPGGEGVGFMDMGSSDLELTTESAGEPHIVGLIFRNVTIPKGATITNAYVQFEVDEAETCVPNLTVLGAKLATVPAPFTGAFSEISSKPKTTATVAWSPGPWSVIHERGAAEQTPNIKTIVQEIIGVTGWASGNNMMIMLTDLSTVECHQTVEAYEGEAAGAADLVVTYTGATGVDPGSVESSIIVYPNPTEGKVSINNPSTGNFGYAIYTISGQLVTSKDDNSGSTIVVDMSSAAKGTYLVEVKAAGKTVKQKLILK
jgi:hypothetical protein